MFKPGQRTQSLAALACIGAVAAQLAYAQEAELETPSSAEILASELADGLPCTATGTSAALEERLDQRLEPLVDLATALDVVALSDSQCAEVRAAAARQRQFIAATIGLGPQASDLASSDTALELPFEAGPPPLNLMRGRREGR